MHPDSSPTPDKSGNNCGGRYRRILVPGSFWLPEIENHAGKSNGVAHAQWQCAQSAQDALPGRDHACDLRTPRLHCLLGGTGAQATGEPDALSRVFAPNSKLRAWVTPAKRTKANKANKARAADEAQDQTPAERRAAMT